MEGIRNYPTAIFLVLVLLTTGMEGKMKPSTRRSLEKIKISLTSAGKNVGEKIDKLANHLDSVGGGDSVATSIETIGGAVPSLTSGDTVEIISGTLDVISAVTALIPGKGQIISMAFSLIGTVFGAIAGGGGDDVGTIVRRELNKYEDENTKEEYMGIIRLYKISHAYLASKEGNDTMNEHDLTRISCNVPIYQKSDFLGVLIRKVKENSNSSEPVQVKRAMEYLQLYVTLAVLRSSILWEMYALVRTVPGSSTEARSIKAVAIAEEGLDKTFLKFLLDPVYSKAVFFAYFNPSEWPTTRTFMRKKGLNYQRHNHLIYARHSLRPQKWTNWYMYMTNDPWGTMAGTKSNSSQSRFYFDPISLEDSLFYLRSSRWRSWYVYMKNDAWGYCRGRNGKPGTQGQWKVIKFNDGNYMLSPKRWPKWFIYMKGDSRGHIRGWAGDPGIQGHWLIS